MQSQAVEKAFDGTRFIFAWAKDPDCALRNRLGRAAITPQDIDIFIDKVTVSVPRAILFLRHIQKIEIRRNGLPVMIIERRRNADIVTVEDSGECTRWHIIEGTFEAEAATLKRMYSGLIEPKRSARVAVAISDNTAPVAGVCYATLPTQHSTNLPVHINADSFPESNRKHLAFGSGYEGAHLVLSCLKYRYCVCCLSLLFGTRSLCNERKESISTRIVDITCRQKYILQYN